MPIVFSCPHCGHRMNVADQYAGQSGPCSSCGKQISIPSSPTPFANGPAAYAPAKPTGGGAGKSLFIILGVALCCAVICCGILLALLLPAVSAARQAAKRAQSTNNLRMITLALHNYHDTYNSFPPAVVKDENGAPLYSGRVLLLPYLEQAPLYDSFDKTKAWNAPENVAATSRQLKVFEDPNSQGTSPRTDYLFVTGPGTIFEDGTLVKMADVTDGLSNTLFVIETAGSNIHWAEPRDLDISQLHALPPGHHAVGNLAGLADGSVHTLGKNTPPATLRALSTRNGGEPVSY